MYSGIDKKATFSSLAGIFGRPDDLCGSSFLISSVALRGEIRDTISHLTGLIIGKGQAGVSGVSGNLAERFTLTLQKNLFISFAASHPPPQ